MKKEYIEIQIKGKTQNAEHILFHYDRYYHQHKNLKVPLSFFYDQFVSDKVLDNIFTYMDGDYSSYVASVVSVGQLKNDFYYFQKNAFTNNLMNKFLVTSENRQFTEFFSQYNEENKQDLKGFSINCMMLEYNYIQQKQQFEQKQKQLTSTTSDSGKPSISPNFPNRSIKERCDKLRDELSVVTDKINLMNMKVQNEGQKRVSEINQYKQRKQRLKTVLKTEDDKNKRLLRQIYEVSAQKKMLEQQKQNMVSSFNDILQKEVQKKLKDYQDMLRAKHRDEIFKMEQTYNFDIAKRKKIAQDMADLKSTNTNLKQSLETSRKIINDILLKQKTKITEFKEQKKKIQEIETIIKLTNEQKEEQNDILNCKLCYERPAQIIFRPCGHLIYCDSCWIDYLTDERDPYVNQTKYMCLMCHEFRNVCIIEGFCDKKD